MFCNWVFLPWSDSYCCLFVTQVVAKVAHFRLCFGKNIIQVFTELIWCRIGTIGRLE